MNSPRYTLSPQDVTAVRAYLQRKLATQPYWLDNRQAEGEWDSAKRDPLTLKHRRDRTGTGNPPVNVTLSRRAGRSPTGSFTATTMSG